MQDIRVLYVDDEPDIREVAALALGLDPALEVRTCGSGPEALEMAASWSPSVILMDIMMPGMDGLTAAERIVDQDLAAVLILTAYSGRELVQRAVQAGAMGYLVKPFQKSDLLPAIELALARHSELMAVKKESADLVERLETRKVVDKAKGRLMDEHGMTEADAFRRMQKRAMDERRSMKEVALELLEQKGPEEKSQ